MIIKDEYFQRRSFILSSFSRLQIPFTASVYRFADKIIYEKLVLPLINLDDVDREIKQKYYEFLQNG